MATGRRKRRPNFSTDFKRRLAQQASAPGVSVSHLAQQHGINVNMLFKWRRHLVAGLFDTPRPAQVMLPVAIVDAPASEISVPTSTREAACMPIDAPSGKASGLRYGVIEIQIADATVRFEGPADLPTLRSVLQMLRT